MELNSYIDSEYFTGTIPTNLEAPKLPDFSTPVKYSTGGGGVEFGFSMKKIPLTQEKFALVDDTDFDKVNQFKWYARQIKNRYWYALRRDGENPTLGMHRFIISCPDGFDVDHRDGNGLNNRRRNLRVCTRSQNTQNIQKSYGYSKYKGVSYHIRIKKWIATLGLGYKMLHLGYHDREIDAGKAYDNAAKEHFGEFAHTNKMIYPEDFD